MTMKSYRIANGKDNFTGDNGHIKDSLHRRYLEVRLFYGPELPRIQIEVLGHSLSHSLAPLTHSFAPHYSLRSRASLRSLVRSLAHFAHSLARGTVND